MTIHDPQGVATASPNHGTAGVTSLLGASDRGMKLKISRDVGQLSSKQASEVIELASRKCLVGSAANCDVRVDNRGIAPVECLILHGEKNNVVRWLTTSNEFAGGELFEDEVLRAGDPLQVGSVELEVLIDQIMNGDDEDLEEAKSSVFTSVADETLPAASEDRLALYLTRLERLEDQLSTLQHASDVSASEGDSSETDRRVSESITELAAQLAVLQSRNATDRSLWTGEKAELEALLQSRLQQLDQLQAEVQRLRDELAEVRAEYSESVQPTEHNAEVEELSRELAERTAGFKQEVSRWDEQRSDFHRQMQESLERLSQVETQLASQEERQAESEAARQAAEERAERLQQSVDELSERLAEQQAEFDRVRAEWDKERESLESELAETKEHLSNSTTTESIELELREAWERERTALQSQIEDANSRLEDVQEELEAHQELARSAAQREFEVSTHQAETHTADDDRPYKPDVASERKPEKVDRESAYSDTSYNPMDRLLAGESYTAMDSAESDSDSTAVDAIPMGFSPLATQAYNPTQYSAADETDLADQYQPAAFGGGSSVESRIEPTIVGDEPELSPIELARQRLAAFHSPSSSDDVVAEEVPSQGSFDKEPTSDIFGRTDAVTESDETEEYGYRSGLFNATQDDSESQEEDREVKPTTNDPPVSTADVLARMGQATAWDEDDDEDSGMDTFQSGLGQSESRVTSPLTAFSQQSQSEAATLEEPPRYTPPSSSNLFSPPGAAGNAESEGDEESIEAYMARLMKRVRATDDDDETPTPVAKPKEERAPVTEYTEVTPASLPKPTPAPASKPEPFSVDEYKPRSQAPELADRMTAMRSLANDSARSAIASHAKRNWSSVMKMKLGVSMFAFVAVVASLVFFWGNAVLIGLGSLVGLGVLGYWARTAITYRKLLLDSLMLEPQGGRDDSEGDL